MEKSQSKANEQKLELMRAVFRNMYLKEKHDYLDGECRMLAEHVLSSQISNANNSENIPFLKKELDCLKQQHEEKQQALIVAEKKIQSLSSMLEETKSATLLSLNRNKSINEEVSLKDEMIKCLQEELVEVRLAEAEKWALIRELQEIKNGLEKDKDALTSRKPVTVSNLQEEIMTTNQTVSGYSSEFSKIKKQLTKIKTNSIDEQDFTYQQESDAVRKADENVKLTAKGAEWKRKGREEINEILSKIKQLEIEKANLQQRIQELQKKLDVLNMHLRFKDEEMCELRGKLNSARLKQQNVEKIMEGRIREYNHLEEVVMRKLSEIQNSINEKNENIDELSNKLNALTSRRQSIISAKVEAKEKNTVEDLENQVFELQEKINILNSDIFGTEL